MLNQKKWKPFTSGEIKPLGWLKQQLEVQAAGLAGNLDKVWPDIKDSAWIGGNREGWERVPYWLDGFIPLAYLLDNDDMKQRAQRYINQILAGQHEDGFICPCKPEERSRYDMWALMLIAKVLVMYADLSGDERVAPALYRAMKQFDAQLRGVTLANWGASRWFECLISIYWLYERYPEEWLLNLPTKLEIQGINYDLLFTPFTQTVPKKEWSFLTHVVNYGMCLKQGALKSLFNGGDPDAFAIDAINKLLKFHGMAVEHFTGDECIAGNRPIQGSELCGVVEAMYSYEILLSVSGNPIWGDFLEKLAFNALPATYSADMWTHQYLQQTNQIRCAKFTDDYNVFGTNSPDAHVFGLEPNYGCCTANMGQAWPKFAASLFMKSDNGFVITAWSPAVLNAKYKDAQVKIKMTTNFPFGHAIKLAVETDKPVDFSLRLRIPSYVDTATVNGKNAKAGEYFEISKKWSSTEEISVEFGYSPKFKERPNNMRCLWNGPLLYSLPIEEEWIKREYERGGVERKFPYCDYDILPKSEWNFAFSGTVFDYTEKEITAMPFDTAHPAVEINAIMSPVEWNNEHGCAAPQPVSRLPIGEKRKMRLIPYGCTQLRMTEMPYI